eukprot:CAMPEP_0203636010 /NCGR_PEP_ID=MMETSP0088-20131115/2648_1 /ASSEMBLY_ACC=CAM_ASM_001087 /TAXON_ID=426623 /ORGANISM="Chaetoceros affinis, Strain CCMP159" /LENGTH=378 /DNA_ID=CAMNT_0050490035 /DNA_START=427 /DNA_END=1563 /DNA_ORIENTATION=-
MRTFTSLVHSAEDVLYNIEKTEFDTLMTTAQEFSTNRDNLVTDLAGFCPAAANNINGLYPTDVTADFILNLNDVGDLSDDVTWSEIQNDFSDLEELMKSLVSFLTIVNGPTRLWFILSTSVTSVLAILLIYMLVCAWKTGKEGYQFIGEGLPSCNSRFLHFLGTPLFALLLASIWFGTSFIFASHASNADLCYDEILTGETVLRMLNERGYASTSEAYLFVDEYLHGCLDKNVTPSAVINAFETTIDDTYISGSLFQDLAPNGDVSSLDVACVGDASAVMTKSDALMVELETFKNYFESLQKSLSCETMATIMQQALYEKQCQSLSRGLLWLFISGLVVSSFGTIMLSLRSATQRPQIYIVAPNPASRSSDDASSYGL